jgi:hypothetical protein
MTVAQRFVVPSAQALALRSGAGVDTDDKKQTVF